MDVQVDAPIPFVSSPGPMVNATAVSPPNYVAPEVGEASNLAPSDNNDDDLLEQLLQVLDDLPYPSKNANGEASGIERAGSSEFDLDDGQGRINSFGDPSSLAGRGLTNHMAATNEDLALESVTAEVATENYLELNDFFFLLDQNGSSDFSALDFPTSNGPFAESPHFSSMNISSPVFPIDEDIYHPTANNFLPQGANLNDDLPASIWEVDDFASDTNLLYDTNVQLQDLGCTLIDPYALFDSAFVGPKRSTFG